MKKFKIVKRSGAKVSYDPEKIKERINLATEGLNVNQLELESFANFVSRDGISTKEIQQSLINSAVALSDIVDGEKGGYDFSKLDWRFVAARLLLQDIFKECSITKRQTYDDFGYNAQNFLKFVKKAVSNHLYDSRIIEEYNDDEILEIGNELCIDYDLQYDYAAVNLLSKRYLLKQNGSLIELPQEMYGVIALFLALPEKKENRIKWAKDFYHALGSRKISLATPLLMNLRIPNGNLSSCFTNVMDDSLTNINWVEDNIAQISKNGGGVGTNISKIRASGSWIRGHKGAAGGVLPWVKKINDIAIAVNQLGSRKGAVTVSLDVWHYDILDFLDVQKETGDPRTKSFDVFPQLVVNDVFMSRALTKGRKWTMFCPWEVKEKLGYDLTDLYGKEFEDAYNECEKSDLLILKHTIDANELMKHFLKTAVETGLPYVFFKDTVNKVNPNKHKGSIYTGNLCMESFSTTKPSYVQERVLLEDNETVIQKAISGETHVCNLVSQNLAVIDDMESLSHNTNLSVRILDNAIELSAPPVPEAKKHNNDYRIIGVGALGLADWFVKNKLTYKKGAKEAGYLFEFIGYHLVKSSHELSKERGSYPNFEGSEWSKGVVFGKDKEWFETREDYKYIDKDKWLKLIEEVKKGIRNGGLGAIAPNTSTSLMMGATASVLPIFKKFFIDSAKNGNIPIVPPFFNQETMWLYQENRVIDQRDVINVTSEIQSWTDQGISMELLVDFNREKPYNAKEIRDLYKHAWKKGCKTVYYFRSVSKKENAAEACESCAG